MCSNSCKCIFNSRHFSIQILWAKYVHTKCWRAQRIPQKKPDDIPTGHSNCQWQSSGSFYLWFRRWHVIQWKVDQPVWWKCRHESFRRLVRVLQCSSSSYFMLIHFYRIRQIPCRARETRAKKLFSDGRFCTWTRVFFL